MERTHIILIYHMTIWFAGSERYPKSFARMNTQLFRRIAIVGEITQ